MGMNERTYSSIANSTAKEHLQGLLDSKKNPTLYREHMENLGKLLAESLVPQLGFSDKCLVISTAEDADFLQAGVETVLKKNNIHTKLAVFWNNHYKADFPHCVL